MKQRFFGLLIVLMTSSLAGIICLQGYLIADAYKGNERHFDLNVKQALKSATSKIENQEFLRNFDVLKKASERLSKKDNIFSNICAYDVGVEKVNEEELHSNIKLALDSVVNAVKSDTIINCLKLKHHSALALSTTSDYEYSLYQSLISEFTQKLPTTKRVNKHQIEFHLRHKLTKNNVNIPYQFAIYRNGMLTPVRSKEFKYSKKNVYRANIFENSDEIDYKLVVIFTGKKAFVIKSISLMIILSVMLSLVIMATFFYAYKLLDKQRNVSEIKTDFINNMTHELKTPIATIKLALDFIRNPKVVNDETMRENYLNMIDEENRRIHAQVENVLQISRLGKGEFNTSKKSENFHAIVKEAISKLDSQIKKTEANIKLELNAEKANVLGNQSNLVSTIINIIDNSLKYSKNPPKINIKSENNKNSIILRIKDDGVGIRKKSQKSIFDVFFRESTGNVHNVKGCGLGLTYVKQILDDHHGKIIVESKKGKGTQITLKLPLI